MTEEILGFLQNNVVEYKRLTNLSRISTVRIGGIADMVVYPNSTYMLAKLVKKLNDSKIPYKILGRMSNVLMAKDYYQEVIIRTDRIDAFNVNDNNLTVSTGISLSRLAKIALNCSLSGLEALSGIPGSIGGAIRGNAGAYGREMSDIVSSVTLLEPSLGDVFEVKNSQLDFSYRHSSVIQSDLIILSAKISLCRSTVDAVYSKMIDIANRRRAAQPTEFPTLGSVFKRCEGDLLPWQLIDGCGLRGYSVGDAEISKKHAGFIVNRGSAKASDFLSVVEQAEKSVLDRYKIKLEREIEVI